jgi:hypothetical protein
MFVNGIPYEQWNTRTVRKVYEVPSDVWELIKEFAGIYSIGLHWDYVSKLTNERINAFYCSLGIFNKIRRGLHGLRKYKTIQVWNQLYTLGVDFAYAPKSFHSFGVGDGVILTLWNGVVFKQLIVKNKKKTIKTIGLDMYGLHTFKISELKRIVYFMNGKQSLQTFFQQHPHLELGIELY